MSAPPSSASSPLDEWLSHYIPKTHASVGLANLSHNDKEMRTLLTHQRLPEVGWSDHQIQGLLHQLATLDTNQKEGVTTNHHHHNSCSPRWCGVGEREGRVFSSLVRQRHYGFSHGIGRSGDLRDAQPKAAGSTLLVKLTTELALDAMRRVAGLRNAAKYGIFSPMCTGMSIALVLSALRNEHQQHQNHRNVVLWSRIDQKSCFKAILAAGLVPVVVPTKLVGDQVVTDMDALRELVSSQTYRDNVLAIVTTTSCFAPRIPDRVDQVAKLCADHAIAHVINHAYGLQCAKTCKLLERAHTIGRVDAIVVSTDKNFMVPVGGAIILGPDPEVLEKISKVYAGRASASSVLDLFVTLLSMGVVGYRELLNERNRLIDTFLPQFRAVAERYGERLLECTGSNTISFAMTVDSLARPIRDNEDEAEYLQAIQSDISKLGAMLFTRCVSGTRVIPRGIVQTIHGTEFVGFGSSYNAYPNAYLTAAVAIGLTQAEVDAFFKRLDKTLKECFKKKKATAIE